MPLLDTILRIIFLTLLLFAAVELLAAVAWKTYYADDDRLALTVYRTEPWSQEHFRDFANLPEKYFPYTGHREVANHSTSTITIDAQRNRLTTPQCPSGTGKTFRIFFFGGSTMWGTGARDAHTIPSLVARTLCVHGIPVQVTNFGSSAYTSTDGLLMLLLQLRQKNLPDIVVFYDGANDVYAAWQSGIAGVPQNMENRERDFNSRSRLNLLSWLSDRYTIRIAQKIVGKFLRAADSNAAAPLSSTLSADVAQVYLRNIAFVQSLADDFHFTPLFYWQPVLFTKSEQSVEEQELIWRDASFGDLYHDTTTEIQRAASVTDLSAIFATHPETLFIAQIHLSEAGNQLIADRLSSDLLAVLQRRGAIGPLAPPSTALFAD